MPNQKSKDQERKVLVTIRSGRRKETHEYWKYWEIVGVLQWMGADRLTAYDTAKWLQKAKTGDRREIEPNITLEVQHGEEGE